MAEDLDRDEQEEPSALRKAAEDGKAARAEAEALKREVAFMKAGVDTGSKLGQLLLKTYEGELDPEAIQAEWIDIAPAKVVSEKLEEQETETPADPEDLRRQQVRSELHSGSATDDLGELDDRSAKTRAWDKYTEERKSGVPRDLAARAYFGEMIQSAAGGDGTAIFDEQAFYRLAREADGLE